MKISSILFSAFALISSVCYGATQQASMQVSLTIIQTCTVTHEQVAQSMTIHNDCASQSVVLADRVQNTGHDNYQVQTQENNLVTVFY